MITSNSELGAQDLLALLTGENQTVALDFLEEFDARTPTRGEAAILKDAFAIVRNPLISFQLKKSLRLAAFKLKNTRFKVSLDGMEKLLADTNRLEDLVLAVTTVETAEGFLAADMIRQANWTSFPSQILPNFCIFFKKHGSIQDSSALQELTRHPEPMVITAALSALEKIDPENLQSIIVPLLDSPMAAVKAQAIQAFYRWNKHQALQHLLKLMFSKREQDMILALHHANYFPFAELESPLLRLMTEVAHPPILMRISQILKNNANPDMPFRIFWVNRSLEGQHQSLVKGILLGVIRTLADKKLIDVSAQEYLTRLKEKVRQEELKLLKSSCKIEEADLEESEALLPTVEELAPAYVSPQQTEVLPDLKIINRPEAKESEAPEAAPPPEVKKPALPAKAPADFSTYPGLSEQERVQFLTRLTATEFQSFKPQLDQMLESATGKELAGLISVYGKYSGPETAPLIKKFFKSDNQDVICAAIKAAVKIDQETLCLYLPQFMQDKNGKIRMTATRTFVSIDRESIKSLMTGLLSSVNIKQRTLAISTALLVDFNIVRQPLLSALMKETSVELIEKIGLVLAANPDRELLYDTYKAFVKGKASLKAELQQVLYSVADKLSIVLNKINTAEELVTEAENNYALEAKELEVKAKADSAEEAKEVGVTLEQLNQEDVSLQTILASKSGDVKVKRAKATIIIWILVAIAWGGAISMIILKLLTGE